MIKLRDYQEEISYRASDLMSICGFVYLAMQVRTGKTLTSLASCSKFGARNVLFVTKKKAISSIEKDYQLLSPSFAITVTNYESLHKIDPSGIDVLILDEAHRLGAYPKPGKAVKEIRDIVKRHNPAVILLSGTPTPESYSQMYHQVFFIPGNPFSKYQNFYKFAKEHVDVKQIKIGGMLVNDYSCGRNSILDLMAPYTIRYTQEEAGFVATIEEKILICDMKPITKKLIKLIQKDRVIEGKDEVILADTAAKLMGKIHQLSSGTIKFESGNTAVLDPSKAEFIKEHFEGKKLAIFYKFVAELDAIRSVFGDSVTQDIDEFNSTGKHIALQIASGREGINLSMADYIVYYNIDFSATSYWQSRDRMTTMDRKSNTVYWIFSSYGIESDIYDAVQQKKDYTLNHFKKTFGIQ